MPERIASGEIVRLAVEACPNGIEQPVIGRVSRQARPITFRKVERHESDNTRCRSLPDTLSGMESGLGQQQWLGSTTFDRERSGR
jgi:hypothetical protein